MRHQSPDQLQARRRLIPADGFYEWDVEGKKQLPRRLALASGEPFAFAGLWDAWKGGGEAPLTCCPLTTTANELVREVHDRMPVILPRESYAAWLDPATPEAELDALLTPYPAGVMRMTAADPVLDSPKRDGPECLEAA